MKFRKPWQAVCIRQRMSLPHLVNIRGRMEIIAIKKRPAQFPCQTKANRRLSCAGDAHNKYDHNNPVCCRDGSRTQLRLSYNQPCAIIARLMAWLTGAEAMATPRETDGLGCLYPRMHRRQPVYGDDKRFDTTYERACDGQRRQIHEASWALYGAIYRSAGYEKRCFATRSRDQIIDSIREDGAGRLGGFTRVTAKIGRATFYCSHTIDDPPNLSSSAQGASLVMSHRARPSF